MKQGYLLRLVTLSKNVFGKRPSELSFRVSDIYSPSGVAVSKQSRIGFVEDVKMKWEF